MGSSSMLPGAFGITCWMALSACAARDSHPQRGDRTPRLETEASRLGGREVVETTLDRVGIDASAMDRRVDPCSDFYQFACGGWIAHTEMPSDVSLWSRIPEVQERTKLRLRQILESAALYGGDDSTLRRLGKFYAACMDEEQIEKSGLAPVRATLAKVAEVRDARSAVRAIIDLHRNLIWTGFELIVRPDFTDASRMGLDLQESRLGLPDRDDYLTADPKATALRRDYVGFVERMLVLGRMPVKEAKLAALDVIQVETEIARIARPRVERRDPWKRRNVIDVERLKATAPTFAWDAYFEAMGLVGIQEVNVRSIDYLAGLDALLKTLPSRQWRHYLTWKLISDMGPASSKALYEEDFQFERLLKGAKELPARWKLCVDSTKSYLPELLAQPYVQQHLSTDDKSTADRMVRELTLQFGKRLRSLEWMDEITKARAIDKLSSLNYVLGYPVQWKQYDFAISNVFGENVLAGARFWLQRQLAKVGRTVDRQDWAVSPLDINTYFEPWKNMMIFPAGILQPPFFSGRAGLAANLGAFGTLAGHEITHGFDDQGSKYAKDGSVGNWWEPETSERFKSRTKCLQDQYAAYEVLPGVHVNGELTLGENIADAGGVRIAFDAYRELTATATNATVAEGFTQDQQFFLAFGQAWCTKTTEELSRVLVRTDEHSPAQFRVNGSLTTLPEFAQAFACAAGAPMHPRRVCTVW